MNRIGNRIDRPSFKMPQLGDEFCTPKKKNAASAPRSQQHWSEPQLRQALRFPSGEGAKVRGSSSADQATQRIQEYFKNRFAGLAGDAGKFHDLMKNVYGRNYDKAAAESFRQKALSGDFGWLPKIEFQSGETLQGASGAFDASCNVVYLNEKFKNDPLKAAEIYSEEVGHFLDTKLKKTDTMGDEGEMFRRLLAGEQLTKAQKAAIGAEDDQGVIDINGKPTQVEFFLDDLVEAGKDLGEDIIDGAEAVVDGIVKAIVGGAEEAGGFVGNATEWLVKQAEDLAKKAEDAIAEFLAKAAEIAKSWVDIVEGGMKMVVDGAGVAWNGVLKVVDKVGVVPALGIWKVGMDAAAVSPDSADDTVESSTTALETETPVSLKEQIATPIGNANTQFFGR